MRLLNALAAIAVVAGLLCATGCTKDSGYRKTTGTVTMGGQPLAGASITFYPDASDGEGGSGLTGADGKYEMTCSGAAEGGSGMKPGSYKVTIVKYEEANDEDQKAYEAGEITYEELQKRKGETTKATGSSKPVTPTKFASTFDTPLTATVTEDPAQNVFDFNLDE